MINIRAMALMRGGKRLLQDTSLSIFPGHHVGLVGRNGTGKSSLFALLRGELQVEQGSCELPSQWRIASVKQETPALQRAAIFVFERRAEGLAQAVLVGLFFQEHGAQQQAVVG